MPRTTAAIKRIQSAKKDTRPEIVRKLKATAGEYEGYNARIGPLLQECWRLTWEYVEVTVTLERSKSTTQFGACERLSGLMKPRTVTNIRQWYRLGRFAAENKIQKRPHNAVYELCMKQSALSKSEFLRALDACKKLDGKAAIDKIRLIAAKSSRTAISAGEKKARMMEKKGQWTEKVMRMDLMGTRTVHNRFWGQDVKITVVSVDDGTPLMEV